MLQFIEREERPLRGGGVGDNIWLCDTVDDVGYLVGVVRLVDVGTSNVAEGLDEVNDVDSLQYSSEGIAVESPDREERPSPSGGVVDVNVWLCDVGHVVGVGISDVAEDLDRVDIVFSIGSGSSSGRCSIALFVYDVC